MCYDIFERKWNQMFPFDPSFLFLFLFFIFIFYFYFYFLFLFRFSSFHSFVFLTFSTPQSQFFGYICSS